MAVRDLRVVLSKTSQLLTTAEELTTCFFGRFVTGCSRSIDSFGSSTRGAMVERGAAARGRTERLSSPNWLPKVAWIEWFFVCYFLFVLAISSYDCLKLAVTRHDWL